MKHLYIGEDNLIEIVDPESADTGEDITGATVTFDIKDTNGVDVVTGTSMTWTNANASNRPAYQGVFASADSASLVENQRYVVWLNFNSKQGWRKVTCVAKYHGAEC